MIKLTLAEIAGIVGGELTDPVAAGRMVTAGVEFDSRNLEPGGLFVAIAGERVDGHDFAPSAMKAGAAGVLASRAVDAPAIVVPDVLAALAALAREVVNRLDKLTIVGITASSGKTSTKDLAAQLVARLGPTIAPPGSFNNELGHPHTVLRATYDTRYLVLEKSARGVGHIRFLTEIAPPRIGVVLNVGAAHLGEFGSLEITAQAKGELVETLPAAEDGGVAILNADDVRVAAMSDRTSARVVYFGFETEAAAAADFRATDVTLDAVGRPSFRLHTPEGDWPVTLAMHGKHQVSNALAVAALAAELGMPGAAIAEGLTQAQPRSKGRMQVLTRSDGVTIVDDAYNANPDSMLVGIQALAAMSVGRDTAGVPGRRWAVLGQLRELADYSEGAHTAIGEAVAALGIDQLVVVGPDAAIIHRAAEASRATGAWTGTSRRVADVDEASRLLAEELRPGDVVLMKAANAAGLGRIAQYLMAQDSPTAQYLS